MLKQSEPVIYHTDSGEKLIIELYRDSSSHIFHILEKQESELNLYEDHTDCQGEYVVFPSKNLAFLISKLEEEHGAAIDEEQDSLYLYSKKKEVLAYKGPYKEFNVLWDKQRPELHQPFVDA